MENGSHGALDDSERKASTELWKSRERRVLYSLANCAILTKVPRNQRSANEKKSI